MMNLFLVFSILIVSCLSEASLELCAHDDGEVHIFLIAGACEGEHAKSRQIDDGYYLHINEGFSGHHYKINVQNDKHHEPCEHAFISFDEEWIARTISCIKVDILQKSLLSSHQLTEIDNYPSVLATRSFAPRAPPSWRSNANDYFLRTTRLLI